MIDTSFYKKIGEEAKRLKNYPNEYNPSDPENRDKLVSKNMRIAADIALRAAKKYSIVDEEFDDLLCEAMLGLCVAYDKYQPDRVVNDRPAKFSSVAYLWSQAYVMAEVKRIIARRNGWEEIEDVHPDSDESQSFYDLMYEGVGETNLLMFEMRHGLSGEKPKTLKEISRETGFAISAIKKGILNAADTIRENAIRHGLVLPSIGIIPFSLVDSL